MMQRILLFVLAPVVIPVALVSFLTALVVVFILVCRIVGILFQMEGQP